MPNKLLTCQRIAREALPMLVNNLVVPELFYTDYSKDFVKEGDTIQVEKPAQFEAKDFKDKVTIQEINQKSVPVVMDQIADMSRTLVKEHTTPEERFADLFPSSRGTAHEAVGVCPRCGAPVYEGKKGFFCDNRECSFALWKDNRFFSSKKKSITKSVAAALLKEGRISMSGLYSEKTGKTYDAEVILDDTGGKYVNFKLEFPVKKGRRK